MEDFNLYKVTNQSGAVNYVVATSMDDAALEDSDNVAVERLGGVCVTDKAFRVIDKQNAQSAYSAPMNRYETDLHHEFTLNGVDHLVIMRPSLKYCKEHKGRLPSPDENGVYATDAFKDFEFENVDVNGCPLRMWADNNPNAGGFVMHIEVERNNDNVLVHKLNNSSDYGILVPMDGFYGVLFSDYFGTEFNTYTFSKRGKIKDYISFSTVMATPSVTWKDEKEIVKSKTIQ